MKTSEAVGFFCLGAVMLTLPQLAPGLCPRNGFDGTSGRELWLQIMGTVQSGVGLSGLVKATWIAASEWLASWSEVFAETAEAEAPQPAIEWAVLQTESSPQVVAVDFSPAGVWAERKAA